MVYEQLDSYELSRIRIKRTKRGRIIEGELETCCHRVSWWFDVPTRKRLTDANLDEIKERLYESAEERAKECIIDGCHSGEICCYITDDDYRGWFGIIRD
jgi:hypothetical protein